MRPTRNQALWRCRRGLLELDIVLRQFIEARYDDLDDVLAKALLELLELPDNDLLDLVTDHKQASEMQQQTVLLMMRAHHLRTPHEG
ncbi:succinate dehydrogenase assembly factor 2 [Methylobacillus flagellatus]|uniref:FAD assembly factor SdhE n=1 Tax=Methylobacillus flagellatus TaxID=405 RepID=UPI001485952C|nr:succinate dehydrogenase assembly factor 2 [Methylobacillus flagellatus]